MNVTSQCDFAPHFSVTVTTVPEYEHSHTKLNIKKLNVSTPFQHTTPIGNE